MADLSVTDFLFNGKQLAQLRPSNTTAVSIYSPATHYVAKITKIIVCNTSGANRKFRIFHDINGTTYDETTALEWDELVLTDSSVHVEDIIWMIGADGGNIAVRKNSGSGLTFTVYGNEFKV